MITKTIQDAVQYLKSGDVVAIPTETVYGLAGNIFDQQAIKKIFSLKKRPLFNPLIVHLSSIDRLDDIVNDVPEVAQQLAMNFWPGPLTLILKKKAHIPDIVTAGKPTVGVRIPNHPMTLELLSQLDFPLAAPSANPFTRISPTKAKHVDEYFGDALSLVLDGGECKRGIESTIVGFPDGEPVIYRLGSISVEQIEEIVGSSVLIADKKEKAPDAPGMLSKHYSPKTKTILVKDISESIDKNRGKKIGILSFDQPFQGNDISINIILSKKGDLSEATANLYTSLHALDEYDLDIIIAERLPNRGLGRSINDRLSRATKENY